VKVLVIRLGALGDMVLSFGPFAAIRTHHPHDTITLLTTPPFAELAGASPWFDSVAIDARPSWWNLPGLLRLRRQLRGFDFVYDLQTSSRSSSYFRLAGAPPWSGIAVGCSHPHANGQRDFLHTIERQREQLEMAGIDAFPAPALDWLTADPGIDLPAHFALLVPGAAPHRPAKRWPVARFAALAGLLAARGMTPVVVGTRAEAPLAAIIQAACPGALDLTGRTSLLQLGGVAARASLVVGNDTGPLHLAAGLGCRVVVLFSGASDPVLAAPRGPDPARITVLRALNLSDLPVERVAAALG
jgi:ADP-heptose:LPS heptosyltransferase